MYVTSTAAVFGLRLGLTPPAKASSDVPVSLDFASASDKIPLALPEGVTGLWVESAYVDAGVAPTLRVQAPSGATTDVSVDSAAPTDVTALAGGTVLFTLSGLGASAKVAVFGVRGVTA
jgi:hypothetical protein